MGTMTAAPPPDGIEVHQDVPLARHTYLRLGGPARYFAIPEDVAQLELLLAWARAEALSVRVLGGGSNLLVADEGIDALVVSLRRAAGSFRFEGESVSAGAAVMMPALSRAAAERGLGGLEFAIGIPGAVGGALNSNAGIGDGRAIGNLVESVEVIGGRGRMTIPRDQLHFAYRRSSLRGAGVMVLGATLRLQPRPGEEIEAEQRSLLAHRQATQPTAGPNAGSIFTNPEGDYAGRLIEAAGCKGLAVGAARVSELHANFFVHDGTASVADMLALLSEVQRRVLEHSGVRLQPEIEWWGDGPLPEPFVEPEPDEPDEPEEPEAPEATNGERAVF